MGISGVGIAASYATQVRQQQHAAPQAKASAPAASAARDADGDNDGSLGGTVDVRA